MPRGANGLCISKMLPHEHFLQRRRHSNCLPETHSSMCPGWYYMPLMIPGQYEVFSSSIHPWDPARLGLPIHSLYYSLVPLTDTICRGGRSRKYGKLIRQYVTLCGLPQ